MLIIFKLDFEKGFLEYFLLGYVYVEGFLSILDRLRVVLFDIVDFLYEEWLEFLSVFLFLVLNVVKMKWLRYNGNIWDVLNFDRWWFIFFLERYYVIVLKIIIWRKGMFSFWYYIGNEY